MDLNVSSKIQPHAAHSNVAELLAEQRRTRKSMACPTVDQAKGQTRWFLDHASLKITVSAIL